MARDLGFKRISYGLLRLLILLIRDFGSIEPIFGSIEPIFGSIEPTSLSLICFYPKLEFFVLGFNVDHSKLMRLQCRPF